jgi:hypothetical protein
MSEAQIQIVGEVWQVELDGACSEPDCPGCVARRKEVGKWVYRFHVTVGFMGQAKTETIYPAHYPIFATEKEAFEDMKVYGAIVEKNARAAAKEVEEEVAVAMPPMHEFSDLLKQNMPTSMDTVH